MMPPQGEKDKPGKIFLGNLDFGTVEGTVRSAFEKFGKISELNVIKNKVTGESRGFGFVTYENPADADDAVKAMNSKDLDGNTIKVDHALKSFHASGGERGRGRGRGGPEMGGRGRGSSSMMSRGRGGPFRGRGGYAPRGSMRGGVGREPLLSTPMDGDYGMEEQDGMYERPSPRFKDSLGHPRGSRPGYGREEEGGMERDGRRLSSGYERSSRFETLSSDRSSRPSQAYARQPSSYESLPSERASRAPPSTYSRTDPAGYRRESSTYGHEPTASYERSSAYPVEREPAVVSRRTAVEDPYASRPREAGVVDYAGGAGRTAAREYGQERSSRADLTRDPYPRDPYAAPAREAPAPERAEYAERSREIPPASRERDAYTAGRSYTAAAREPASRSAYPAARGYENREYAKPPAREYTAERNGSYARERESYEKPDPYAADPYARTAEREVAGTAASSRYDAYSARDPYASSARSEKAAFAARDPYGAAVSARGARPEGSVPGGNRGYTRR